MGRAERHPGMTLEAFLAWEESRPERYEFVDGQAFAMTGGTEAHDTIRLNIASLLRAKRDGKPCRPHLDLKLVCPNGRVRYPDVAVVCGPRDPKATRLVDPVVVVEVLSPSTRAVDYIVKSHDYGSVPSVMVYILVSQDEARIDVVRREGALLEAVAQLEGLDAVLDLPEIDATLPLREIYRDVVAA